jgi:hypothetical protein
VDKDVAAARRFAAMAGFQAMTLSGKSGASGNQRAALPVPNLGRPDRGIREVVASRPADEVQLPL